MWQPLVHMVQNIWILTGAALLISVVLTAWAARKKRRVPDSLTPEILRDVGVAFLVAVIVTGLYELHSRTILDTAKMREVLSTVLGYNVPLSAWEGVNTNILKCSTIRRNVKINFEIKPDKSLPNDTAFLIIDYSYDLYWLKSDSGRFTVQHDIESRYGDLTGFDYAVIRDSHGGILEEYKYEPGQKREQEFKKTVLLDLGYDLKHDRFLDDNALHVMNRRHEVINLPGNYTLGFPTLVEGTPENPVIVSVSLPNPWALTVW